MSAVASVGVNIAVVRDWLVLLSRKSNGVRDDSILSGERLGLPGGRLRIK